MTLESFNFNSQPFLIFSGLADGHRVHGALHRSPQFPAFRDFRDSYNDVTFHCLFQYLGAQLRGCHPDSIQQKHSCLGSTRHGPRFQDLERTSDVTGYYSQPPAIALSFKIQHGERNYTKPDHIPDVLVLRKDRVHFREIKNRAKLEEYKEKGSSRFECDAAGHWTSPAGIESAAKLGFGYEVWCPDDVPPLLARNIHYLDPVTKRPIEKWFDGDCGEILKKVAAKHGIIMEELEAEMTKPERLALQWLIGRGIIYADLEKVLLMDTHRVQLFADDRTAKLFHAANCATAFARSTSRCTPMKI